MNLLLPALLCISTLAIAQSSFEKRAYTNKQGQTLPYQILYPKNYDQPTAKKGQNYPLVIVLHGSGERGTDNDKQLTHGGKPFLADSNQTNYPAFVVFPQCPDNMAWSTLRYSRATMPIQLEAGYADTLTWTLWACYDLIAQLQKDERIDKNRIYITGLSMGGFGTFEAIAKRPKLFAAAAPICSGGDTTYCEKYARQVPLWVFHGAVDAVVPPELSRQMVAKLTALGANVTYTEYPGVNHNSWDNAFAEPQFMAWLFAQNKKKRR